MPYFGESAFFRPAEPVRLGYTATMGEEIAYSHFRQHDYARFHKQLADETAILHDWFTRRQLSSRPLCAGYELEAWLVDDRQQPCPQNEALLQCAGNPLLSPELARFNIELNVPPQTLGGSVLGDFDRSLQQLWRDCDHHATALGCNILGIGILPTLKNAQLTLANISTLDRYRALNEQVLRLRKGRSIALNIVGHEHLQTEHRDVMLEAAATSLQIHIQTPQHLAKRYYNAAIVLSAPMVAVSSNSPFLFGKQLWEETRIPVFEQAVPTGGFEHASDGPIQRVGFGMGYARDSLLECFEENREHYPIMLPVHFDDAPEKLRHLRLHNGTVWRWNRPLIGFDDDGTPHLRIEHRVCASGPSVEDNIANIAFFYGLLHFYATLIEPPEDELSFAQSKHNFYRAAQHGINAQAEWLEGARMKIQKLVLDRLLIESETGLHKLDIDETAIQHYLGIIEQRMLTAQTGSAWQRIFAQTHHHDMSILTRTYLQNQRDNQPVHRWGFAAR